MNDVDALIGWLLEAPRGGCPVEDSGATALLSAISGTQVHAVMHARGPRQLTRQEQQLYEDLATQSNAELDKLKHLLADDLPAFNKQVREANIPAIEVK